MIVIENRSWLRMVFAGRGSSLAQTWPRILLVTLFATGVTWCEFSLGIQSYSLTTTPFSLIGIAMAIFLGFRNSAAYDRFWEGRKLWGGLVNVSRTFARQTLTVVQGGDDEERRTLQQAIVRATIAYVHCLRHHLRNTDPSEEIDKYLEDDDIEHLAPLTNQPLALQLHLGRILGAAYQRGYLSEFHFPILEASLTEMTALQGACERIKTTPIPYSYSVLLHRIVAMYCFAMPFGLVQTVGVLTPVVVCFIAYAFFGLDAIGDEVEQPFEFDDNDLPLHAIARTIEINLLQMLDETCIPPPLKPVNGVLM